ncbi:MAG: DNA polymerase/3'-5' exonuclease PolX [Saprospiraceae bacterium]|nr:DNA polymerase/3'-5' exonuclease PolX [Saprospiraceae bacterium]
MTNKEIARAFADLAAIMELHDENPFKIKSYQNAYITLRKLDTPLETMSKADMDAVKGIGKSTSEKIIELLQKGDMQAFRQYADKTPAGVVDMLHIKGFGPKKIQAVWKELGIETVGELLYACNENRLIELHGFGKKTQDEIRKNTEYYLKSRNKVHWAVAEEMTEGVLKHIQSKLPNAKIEKVGELRRLMPVVEKIELLVVGVDSLLQIFDNQTLTLIKENENSYFAKTEDNFPVIIYTCAIEDFGSKVFKYSASRPFLDSFVKHTVRKDSDGEGVDFKHLTTEQAVFDKAHLPFIPAELRENETIIDLAKANKLPNLIHLGDIKGVIHTHTTWSDGLHSTREMAETAQRLGYQYIGISDHSKAAFYANGLKEDRIEAQWQEIDQLNSEFFNFKILKSIECDILNDGSLDYGDDILRGFDFVIASVHTNLKMNEEKATARLIKAIENPFTHILGHPTGRLLLSREGYPIDHRKVIDACAANHVAIELNANPYRLDLDWTWIPYARERGVLISINPDAHSTTGISDIRYGVLTARKGGLDTEGCLNARTLTHFYEFLDGKK